MVELLKNMGSWLGLDQNNSILRMRLALIADRMWTAVLQQRLFV